MKGALWSDVDLAPVTDRLEIWRRGGRDTLWAGEHAETT